MTRDWNEIGFVISSRYRVLVLERLVEGPATPSQIASDTDQGIAHVSRALQELRDHGVVELLVPEERRKGRVYGITEQGTRIWDKMESENLV